MQPIDATPRSGKISITFALFAAAAVGAWLIAVIQLGGAGVFHAEMGAPPINTLIAMVSPPLAFLLLMKLPWFRAQVLAIDPVWLTAVQGLRILGAGFLVAFAFGHLPALFALAAGWGDVLVAILAPFVTAILARNAAFIRSKLYLGFHILGLLDFVGAVLTGLLSRGTIPLLGLSESTAALSHFPLLLIPCFAVPLWICLHISALAQIRAASS